MTLDTQVLFSPIKDVLILSVRSYNVLESLGIKTVYGLAMLNESELLKGKGFGAKHLAEVKEELARHGVELGSELYSAEFLLSAAYKLASENARLLKFKRNARELADHFQALCDQLK